MFDIRLSDLSVSREPSTGEHACSSLKAMAAHVRDQEYRFETDKWFLDSSEVEYRMNNRVSGEGVSFNPFTRLRFLDLSFFFFTLTQF